MENHESFIERADETLRSIYTQPLTLEEYMDAILESPIYASQSTKYLLDAIEALGTREVMEEGEVKERYRFFDDPYNDGEHAILGNTDSLNEFVDTLRSIASKRGKTERIIWIEGPTATGKSEFKRCLVNGLKEYSRTPKGHRYTLEWNISSLHEWGSDHEDSWYESPVQVNPIAIFPDNVKKELVESLNDKLDDVVKIDIDSELDPFSREAYDYLESYYRRKERKNLFSAITDEKHLRVKNYVMEEGRGIGVLHSEDDGSPKERLVGSWMPGMVRELQSRGRKNPQAYSYDGLLSQGNSGISVVEDAMHHADLLQRLLSVSDEGMVKLDRGTKMDIDTLLLIISNPDLQKRLDSNEELGEKDPLKAIKRRLERHRFKYLTNLSIEAELLIREIGKETGVWEDIDKDEIDDRISAPVEFRIGSHGGGVKTMEIAPHGIRAAAMYDVSSRLKPPDSGDVSIIEKAVVFDRGYIERNGDMMDIDDLDVSVESEDGANGIPVTYPRDIISDLLITGVDRSHPDLELESVIMPRDILESMRDGLVDEPMFSKKERKRYIDLLNEVEQYINSEQEQDVIDAIMRDKAVDQEALEEYIEHVYAYVEGEEGGEVVDPDALKMRVFEVEELGVFDESDYDEENNPSEDVDRFREDRIISDINIHLWRQREEGFDVGDVDPRDIPVIRSVLSSYTWKDVMRKHDDLNLMLWSNPPSNTETEEVKDRAISNMIDMFGYSEESAELTSKRVVEEVLGIWG